VYEFHCFDLGYYSLNVYTLTVMLFSASSLLWDMLNAMTRRLLPLCWVILAFFDTSKSLIDSPAISHQTWRCNMKMLCLT
jgi:hypothetical protein